MKHTFNALSKTNINCKNSQATVKLQVIERIKARQAAALNKANNAKLHALQIQ